MSANDKNNFKTHARAAKERLKNGFWEKQINEIDETRTMTAATVIATEKSNLQKREHLRSKLYDDSFEEQEKFYERVKELLNSGDVVTNPIGQLVDKEYISTLSPCSQEKYLMSLFSKFQKCCERYEKEKQTAQKAATETIN